MKESVDISINKLENTRENKTFHLQCKNIRMYIKLLGEIKINKAVEEELSEWRDIPCSWMGRFNCQDVIPSKLSYKFSVISIRITFEFNNVNHEI